MTYYFIKDGDNELGPFTIKQLKSKSIKKDTPVWFAGLAEWTMAGKVHEIKELFVVKLSSPSSPKNRLNRIWNYKMMKYQIKKVSYQLILIRARKNLF